MRAMRFIVATPDAAVHAIAQQLCTELLAGRHTLWLTSGGSNITTEVKIMQLLHAHAGAAVAHLTILPMDERYGKPGHPDSNTQQLRAAGFESGGATWIDVLAQGKPLEETVEYYSATASRVLAEAQAIIGQFGLGADGHVAGLLPGSPACEDDMSTVAGYEWSDYIRLTLTAEPLKQITAGYVLAFGETKRVALKRLQQNEEPFMKLPAKVLWDIPEVSVYNDWVSEEE